MKHGNKEVISDSEAKRFARSLCKRERFSSSDEALDFAFKIRMVVSGTEFARMSREHCRRLSWELERDEKRTRPEPPTVREVEESVEVTS
jgi:hypothetical protein